MIIKHISIRKYVIKWHISLKLGDVIFEQTLQIIYVNDKQFEEHLSTGVRCRYGRADLFRVPENVQTWHQACVNG